MEEEAKGQAVHVSKQSVCVFAYPTSGSRWVTLEYGASM